MEGSSASTLTWTPNDHSGICRRILVDALDSAGPVRLRGLEREGLRTKLTGSLAKEYAQTGALQIILGGLTAACGEEIFFRGFVQQAWGLIPASLLFMLAHFGKRDIRVVSLWSIFQGFYLGLFFLWSKNLLVPMIAHGLFDFGGMIYFRNFMSRSEKTA